ncbi:rhomboid family intramembrane serine protease [Microbacterium sp. YY-01]|uniref:rhomboid family intramembrane serine protease n=1 Tax=Microbacterium sp. YY-01 TaxID=3421634 RepID=UPI003D17BE3A
MKQQRREQSPAQRKAQRHSGQGRVAALVGGRMPVTNIILMVTVAVSLLGMIPGTVGNTVKSSLLFYAPYLYPQLFVNASFEPWRMLTALLVHSGFLHLALNMLGLWMLGRILEPIVGKWRFLALYILSGLGGSVAVALISPGSAVIGASGAVFGLMGALFSIGRHMGADVGGIVIILGINLVIGFLPGNNISWQAHVGGLVVGAIIGFIYARTARHKSATMRVLLLAALTAVLLIVVAVVPPVLLTQ